MTDINNEKPHMIYQKYQPGAESVKIGAQMIIGLSIFIILVIKIFLYFFEIKCDVHLINDIRSLPTLKLVSYGLAYSAGVELAYMLFTPGPDEAIDPLILGLSASTLLVISDTTDGEVSWQKALAVAVFSAAIVALFWTKNKVFNRTQN